MWIRLAPLLLLLTACRSSPDAHGGRAEPADVMPVAVDAEWDVPGVREAFSRGGTYLVRWRPIGGAVPKNEHFELDAWLFRVVGDGQYEPLLGADLAVAGWMPDHGHGMIRRPGATDLGGGHYRVAGMLLHMGGDWSLFFDVIDAGYSERTEFALEL